LSIGNNPSKIVTQIWLLASDADSVLQEETFMNYILKDEATNKVFPNSSSIMFISSFESFKDDKEVKNTMSIAEKYRNEGWVDGVEVGFEKGKEATASKMLELIKSGLSPEEAFRKVNEECAALATLVQSHA